MATSGGFRPGPTRRSILQRATAVAGVGVGGGLLGASEALACHLYVSPFDGAKGCGPSRRDADRVSSTVEPSPAPAESSTDTSRPPAEPSPPPPSGGVLRNASQLVLMNLAGYSLSGPHAGLQGGLDLMTRVAYIPPGQHTRTIDGRQHFDHSDAGIEAGAQQVAKMIISRNTRFGMFDVEERLSINVPASVGYNPSVDGDRAARYDTGSREALRQEAVRYQIRLVRRVKELLGQTGEVGAYNVPHRINWYHANNQSAKSSTVEKEGQDLVALLPLLSFTGPEGQILIDQSMSNDIRSGKITDDMLIHWHAESVRIRSNALGGNARIMPTIWPRLWSLGGASLPNGSAALRPGFMYKLCSALLDAGAQGFVCWTPSVDRNLSSTDQQAMSRSWEEVVKVCRERGFKAIT